MKDAIIGALRVTLAIDSAEFQRGIGNAKKEFENLGTFFKSFSKVTAAVAGGIALVAQQAGQHAKELKNMAMLSESSVEEFQVLAAGAKKFGIEETKLADILKDVQDRLGDFAQTGGGPIQDFFKIIAPRIGVTIKQFQNLSGPQALGLYIESLKKANLNQKDMTYYLEAISSNSTFLIPLFQDGGKALSQYAVELKALGVIMDDEMVRNLEKMGDKLSEAGNVFTGLRNKIANKVAPAITFLSEKFRESAASGGMVASASDFIVNNLTRLLTYLAVVTTAVGVGYVTAFVKARAATLKLDDAIKVTQATMKRSIFGAILWALGEIVYWTIQARYAFGSWGATVEFVKDLVIESLYKINEFVRFFVMSLSAAALDIAKSFVICFNDLTNLLTGFFERATFVFETLVRSAAHIFPKIPEIFGAVIEEGAGIILRGLSDLANEAIKPVNSFIKTVNSALKKAFVNAPQIGLLDNVDWGKDLKRAKETGKKLREEISNITKDVRSRYDFKDVNLFKGAIDWIEKTSSEYNKFADDAWKKTTKPFESIARLEEALNKNKDAAEESFRQIEHGAGSVVNNIDNGTKAAEKQADAWKEVRDAARNAFTSMITGTSSVKEALGNFLMSIAEMLANEAFNAIFKAPSKDGSGAGSNIIGQLVSGISKSIVGFFGFANGTNYAPGGLAVVGERGPELVNLPRGSRVSTAQETKGLLSGGQTSISVTLSPDLEARIIDQANNNAVQIVNNKTPGIVKKSVSAVQNINRETSTYLGKKI